MIKMSMLLHYTRLALDVSRCCLRMTSQDMWSTSSKFRHWLVKPKHFRSGTAGERLCLRLIQMLRSPSVENPPLCSIPSFTYNCPSNGPRV